MVSKEIFVFWRNSFITELFPSPCMPWQSGFSTVDIFLNHCSNSIKDNENNATFIVNKIHPQIQVLCSKEHLHPSRHWWSISLVFHMAFSTVFLFQNLLCFSIWLLWTASWAKLIQSHFHSHLPKSHLYPKLWSWETTEHSWRCYSSCSKVDTKIQHSTINKWLHWHQHQQQILPQGIYNNKSLTIFGSWCSHSLIKSGFW